MTRQDYSDFLKDLYGSRVQKLNVNAGFSCPNRDGKLGVGGCVYCNNASFTPAFSLGNNSVTQQLLDAKQFYSGKYRDVKYVAYFQSFTGTYAPVATLRSLYNEALAVPEVVGLVISTRPDCLDDEVLSLLEEINQHHKVIVEIGVESAHDRTLRLLNRCHTWQCAQDAIWRVHGRGILVGAHLILGLPGETEDDMMATASEIAKLPLATVKFHQLQVIKGTRLAQQWSRGDLDIISWTPSEYASLCRRILTQLPPHITVERMVSTAPAHLLLHPKWGLKPEQFRKLFETIL